MLPSGEWSKNLCSCSKTMLLCFVYVGNTKPRIRTLCRVLFINFYLFYGEKTNRTCPIFRHFTQCNGFVPKPERYHESTEKRRMQQVPSFGIISSVLFLLTKMNSTLETQISYLGNERHLFPTTEEDIGEEPLWAC